MSSPLAKLSFLVLDDSPNMAQIMRVVLKGFGAEVMYEAADPFSRKFYVDRGLAQGVMAGAPVITEGGVIGQVTRVYPLSSEVTLLTDRDAAIPLLNTRTQLRAAAFGGAAQGSGIASFLSLAPLFLVFVVFYFLMIRPQQKRMKTLQQAVEAVKKGDNVVTAGGIVGKVTRVEDTIVEVEIAPNTRVRVVKSTLTDITSPNSKPAND